MADTAVPESEPDAASTVDGHGCREIMVSERGPASPLDTAVGSEPQKPFFLIDNPQVAGGVLSHRTHLPKSDIAHRDVAITFHVTERSGSRRCNPDTPAYVADDSDGNSLRKPV